MSLAPETHIVYHPQRGGAVQIGVVTAAGKVLDKAAWHTLCGADRLRAYLLMVYPAARTSRTLARACGVPYASVATLLRQDVMDRRVQTPGSGQYCATPAQPPAHVRRVRGEASDATA